MSSQTSSKIVSNHNSVSNIVVSLVEPAELKPITPPNPIVCEKPMLKEVPPVDPLLLRINSLTSLTFNNSKDDRELLTSLNILGLSAALVFLLSNAISANLSVSPLLNFPNKNLKKPSMFFSICRIK